MSGSRSTPISNQKSSCLNLPISKGGCPSTVQNSTYVNSQGHVKINTVEHKEFDQYYVEVPDPKAQYYGQEVSKDSKDSDKTLHTWPNALRAKRISKVQPVSKSAISAQKPSADTTVVRRSAGDRLAAKRRPQLPRRNGKSGLGRRTGSTRGVGDTIKHHVGHWAGKAWDWAWRRTFGALPREAVALASISTEQAKQELGLMRDAVRLAIGTNPIRITLNYERELTATVTSGVVNTILDVDASQSSEFASLAALFSEYKVSGGEYIFTNYLRSLYTFGTTSATLASSVLALTYAENTAALTSTLDAMQDQQHALYINGNQDGSVKATILSPNRFSFRVTPGVYSAGATSSSGVWVPVGSPQSFGKIKSYAISPEVVAKDVVAGAVVLHCEFRNRE